MCFSPKYQLPPLKEAHFILIVVHFEVDRLSNSTTEHIENTLDLINALKKLSSRTIK